MEGIIAFALLILILGLGAVPFILPFIALTRAGRAARKAEQSEKNEKELSARLAALEQQVIKLAGLVAHLENLKSQVQHSKKPAKTTVSEPAWAPLQVTPAQPIIETPEPPPAAAHRDYPEIGEAPGIVPLVPPPPPPPPVVHAPHGVTRLDKALHAELPVPSTEVPSRVQIPAPSQTPLPPVEIPPQQVPPPMPSQPVAQKVSAAGPRPEVRGQSVPPRPAPRRRPVPSAPILASRPPGPSLGDRMMRLLNIEEVLGTNYLGKLGVIILVIGVAGFAVYKFSSLPVQFQFLAAYVLGLAMLVSGVRFEGGRYRLLARAGIGGGWASIFVTTWALHHAGKPPLVASETLDLILMLLVALGMVIHTLKYDSQVVSGLALLLPSLTITVTLYFATDVADAVRIPSLVASAILALGLAVIVVRRDWFELEVFGIASTFVNHFLWIRPLVERHQAFPEYYASAALLVAYWAVFRASYIARKIKDPREEAVSTVAALLNTILLLAVLKYQALHPEMAFYFLLALGAVELTLGQLPAARRRRTAFVILSTLGATFLVAALPYKLSGATLPVVWLAEAEAFFLAGVFTREIVFRRLGMIAGLIVAARMDWMAFAQVTDPKFTGLQGDDVLKTAVVFGTAALVFYLNSHAVPRRWPDLVNTSLEDWSFRGFSYIAGSVALLGLWLISPEVWTAVAWGGFAVVLALLGAQFKFKQLSTQVPAFAAAAIVRVFTVNYYATGSIQHVSLRLITVALTAATLYAASRWMRRSEVQFARAVAEAQTWAATGMVAVLIWHECPEHWRAVGWAAMMVALAGLGRYLKLREFSRQAHVLGGAAFAGCFVFNLATTEPHHHDGLRLAVVFLTAGSLYLSSVLLRWTKADTEDLLAEAHMWTATALLALLAWYELRSDYVAPVWCAMAFALVTMGSRLKRRGLSAQGHLLALAGLTSAFAVNFSAATLGQYNALLLSTVGMCAALLYLCSPWSAGIEWARNVKIPEAYTWAGSALVSFLIWYELQPVGVAVGWALFAIVLFELGFGRRSVSLRFQAYVAFCASFARSLYVNFNAAGNYGEISLRVWTTVFLALVYFYAFGRLVERSEEFLARDRTFKATQLFGYLGSVTVAALLRSELDPNWVIVGWALMILILVGVAWKLKFRIFLHQGLLLSFAVLYRTVLFNFYQGDKIPVPSAHGRLLYVGVAVALLLLSVPLALQLRASAADSQQKKRGLAKLFAGIGERPEQALFFIPYLMLTIVLWLELPNAATLSWGLEGVVIFLFALWAGQRSYRLAAVALLLACVVRIGLIDLWKFNGSYRWLTAMGLGIALIVVSFLYTRYPEAIRRYL